MGQFMDGKAAVAHEDDAAPWQPATELQCALPRPVGQQFMVPTTLMVGSLGRGKQGQDRQGLYQARPWHRGQHHEAQPTQAAGFDEMAVAGAHWIPVDAPCADPASPSAFDGVVHANDDGAIGHEPFDHQAQQSPGNGTGAPAGSVEDLVVACKVGSIGPAGHVQAGADGTLARRQQSSHDQNKDMFPTGRCEAGAQLLEPLAQDLGNGIADGGVWMVQHPMLRIPDITCCKAMTVRRSESGLPGTAAAMTAQWKRTT